VAWIDHRRAGVAWDRGNAETAISTHQRLLAFHRQRGNRLATAEVLHNLGECRRDIGDFEQAEQDLLAADEIFRSFGAAVALASNTHSLADLALDRRDFPAAIERYEKTLAEEQAGDGGRLEAYCLAGIASAYAATGRDEEAARLWGAVSAAEQQLGFRMLPSERRRYEQHLSHLELDPAWHEGRTLTLQQASASLRPDSTSA
jgi:tetratricopeptide (TPR) repeat protein